MAMLMLQRDGNGCIHRSYRARPHRSNPTLTLPKAPPELLADRPAPIYSNDAGVREIFVTTKEFACIG